MNKSSGAVRVGIVSALAAGGMLVGAVGAFAATPVVTADTRATSAPGKAAGCQGAGLEGEAFGLGSEGAKDFSGQFKVAKGKLGKDTALDVLSKPAKGFITGVVVENKLGNNTYRAGVTPNSIKSFPAKNLVAPTAEDGKLQPLTGWFACIAADDKSIGDTPNGVDNAPPIENETNIIPKPVSDAAPQLPRI
jgi:hypothetical protein